MSQELIDNLPIKEYHFEVFSNENKLYGICLLPLIVVVEKNQRFLKFLAQKEALEIELNQKEYRSNTKDFELSDGFKREFKLDFTL